MMKQLLYFFIILSLGCSRTNHNENTAGVSASCIDLKESDPGFALLTENEEPGEKLLLYGKVVDKISGVPIKGAKLFFYQAGNDGNYNSKLFGMPSFARIRGKVKTDSGGCFRIQTIVPGNYPDEIDGKHIHVIAKAKGYEKWTFEFLFEGWLSESLRKEIQRNNDAIILDLQESGSEQWIVETEIALQPK